MSEMVDPSGPIAGDVPAASSETAHLSWSHPAGMVGLSIVNFLLRIVTLGIYHFWGKTEVRRRIWNAVRVNSEPLAYTGTGRELLLGFLLVFTVVVVPTMLVSFGAVLLLGPNSPWLGLYQIALYSVFFFLTGVAIHRAQRYRLSRTTWRGIRGGMGGSAARFAWTYFWTLALPVGAVVVAIAAALAFLGPGLITGVLMWQSPYAALALVLLSAAAWVLPWRATLLQRILISDMRLGNRPFRFSASPWPLYKRFVGLWLGGLLLIPALVISVALIFGASIAQQQRTGLPSAPKAEQVALLLVAFLVFGLLYGLISAWYRAGMMNHFAAHTTFEGARFRGTATARGLIWLSISNFLIVMLGGILASLALMTVLGLGVGGIMMATGMGVQGMGAQGMGSMSGVAAQVLPTLILIVGLAGLGILLPVAQARSARYFVEHLALDGTLPVAAIAQAEEDRIRRGEGLAQAFDVDAF